MVTAPQTTPYNRNGVREGRLSLRIPSSGANKLDLPFDQAVGHQSHQREQAKKRWRRPSNRQVAPLSLRFYSETEKKVSLRFVGVTDSLPNLVNRSLNNPCTSHNVDIGRYTLSDFLLYPDCPGMIQTRPHPYRCLREAIPGGPDFGISLFPASQQALKMHKHLRNAQANVLAANQ